MMKYLTKFRFLEKTKSTTFAYGIDTREAFGRIIFEFRTGGCDGNTEAKRPSRSTFFCQCLRHLLTKLKTINYKWQMPRAVRNCGRNSRVRATTPRNSQEGCLGFWQTKTKKEVKQNKTKNVRGCGQRWAF